MAEYLYTTHPSKRKSSGKKQTIQTHRKVWMNINGEIPKDSVIHHKNFNKKDNNIKDLIFLTRKKHREIHLNKMEKISK